MAAKRRTVKKVGVSVVKEDKNGNLMFLLLLAVVVILGVLFYTWKEQVKANMRWKAWYSQQMRQNDMQVGGYKGY